MAENQTNKSKRENIVSRMREKYPEKSYEDDEELFGQIGDDYDDYDRQLNEYRERDTKLNDMFAADPRSVHFLSSWSNGEDPAIGLVRLFGDEIKDALDDPDKLDALAEANREYVERVAKNKELEEEYEQNLSQSLQMLEEVQREKGLSDDQVDAAMEFLGRIVADGIVGKFTPESFDMAIKALNHDRDVSSAGYEGEVRGRNAKIQERLRRGGQGDGTAQLDGRNSSVGGNYDSNLGVLSDLGGEDIWKRGGEKRTKYQQ